MDCAVEGKPNVDTCVKLVRELESLAADAYEILEAARGRRRLDLQSRGGWLELQKSLVSERLCKYLPAESLGRLNAMCVRWLYLYRHLAFAASTRPVWNT